MPMEIPMKAPSGRLFYSGDIKLIQMMVPTGFVVWNKDEITLASGRKSRVYVNGRQDTTENPEFLASACGKILQDTQEIMHAEKDERRARFIGIPHVAHGWTPAITMVSHYTSRPFPGFACHAIMRSELKAHGGHKDRWVAGKPYLAKFRDILFDNVVTDSGSKKKAAASLEADGWKLSDVDAMVFVDRQQGGLEEMRKIGFHYVHACFYLLDLTYAFQQLGLWPTDAVEHVEQEIRANQIAA